MLFATIIHVMTPVPLEGAISESLTGDDDDYKPYEETFVNEK